LEDLRVSGGKRILEAKLTTTEDGSPQYPNLGNTYFHAKVFAKDFCMKIGVAATFGRITY